MNRREAAVLGAFTGVLMGPFNEMHEYIEEVMGRPVWTHEMGDRAFALELREAARADFLAICENLTEE